MKATTIKVRCSGCRALFDRPAYRVTEHKKAKKKNSYCSIACKGLYTRKPAISLICTHCQKKFTRKRRPDKTCRNVFCSQTCNATYSNTHYTMVSTKGRSKLEVFLEQELNTAYPSLDIWYNRKDVIQSELDIYFPSLKFAVELNGIFHYEPIFGQEKLAKIQNNDSRKFQACLERGIELMIIDTSTHRYYKEALARSYLTMIRTIIDSKIFK